MEPAVMLMFIGIFTLFAAYPGPAIVTIISHSLFHGRSGIIGLIAGIILGDLFWLSLTLAGLSVLASSVAWAFSAIKYGGALYLLYLAYKAWTSPSLIMPEAGTMAAERSFDRKHEFSSLLSGLALTLGNPKTVVFYLALLPGFMDLERLSWLGIAELAGLVMVLLMIVLSAYAFLAQRMRKLIKGQQSGRIINRISSVLLAGTAVVVASR